MSSHRCDGAMVDQARVWAYRKKRTFLTSEKEDQVARIRGIFSVEVFPEKGWSELLVEDEPCFVSFHVSHQITIPAML